MADGIPISSLSTAPLAVKPKAKAGGIAIQSLGGSKPAVKQPTQSSALENFIHSSGTAVKDYEEASWKSPIDSAWGMTKGIYKGAASIAELAISGTAALAKSMITPVKVDPKLSPEQQAESNVSQSNDNFIKNQKQIASVINVVNRAPSDHQEAAMQQFLQIIPNAVKAVGDTVYDKTGSALAATGALSLATLLTFNPDIAGRVLGKVKEIGKGGEGPSTISTAFDSLAAEHPEAASGLANHVEQVDSKLARYLKNKVQKFVDASDKELNLIGKNAAKAAINELTPPSMKEIIAKGTVKPIKAVPVITPEQASATLRTTAKEGTTAIEEASHSDDKAPGDDTVYFNMGMPVTRAHIEAAFRFARDVIPKIPGVTIAQSKMENLYTSYIETFNPEAKGPAARVAGSAIVQNFFEQAHREHVIWQQGKVRRTYWHKMGKDASMQFVHGFEKGARLSNPVWEKARLAYKGWADAIFQQDMRTGFTYDPIDHYMPHLFKDPEGVRRFMQRRYGNKWGNPGFIKERGFDLYQEAIDAGFTPKYTNPEEIMQARQQASDIAALRTNLLADFERRGIAIKAVKGSTRPPEGFSPNSRRSPTGIRYWVREEADPLMHNAFDSKSLWSNEGLAGSAFRGYMHLKNTIVPIKLMASLFHPVHVMHIDANAELTRASKLLYSDKGSALSRARDFMFRFASSYPFTPGAIYRSLWDNPKTGYPILRVFQGKRDFATLSDADKAAYHDLAEGGMVPTRPQEETSGNIQRFIDAVHQRSLSATWKLPLAAISSLSHPMYNLWIPSLKVASFIKDAKAWRELNPERSVAERQLAFRQIARKVEARYGEMNYKSMFMNNLMKDVGVASTLSLGWQVGLIDQYVGGAIDLGKAVVTKGSIRSKVASGLLDRPLMATHYMTSALVIGGLMHWWFTGKHPQKLIDYTNPESGETDRYGQPIRLNTPFYSREFEGLYKHMEQEGKIKGVSDFILNKGAGVFAMGHSAITGVNGLGNEIRDPNSPAYKQVEQTLAYEFSDLDPIAVEAMQRSSSAPRKMGALSELGFIPAGKYISETVIQGKISTAYNNFVRPKEKPFEAVQMQSDMRVLRKAFMDNDSSYGAKLDAMAAKYDLSDRDIGHLERRFNSSKEEEFNPSVFMFSHLPWNEQKPLLDQMSQKEKDVYLEHLGKEKKRKYERETEQ